MAESTQKTEISSTSPKALYFLVLPRVHALDLSGPSQAFFEAGSFCSGYSVRFCGVQPEVRTAQGFWISRLEVLPEIEEGATVLVAGIDSSTLSDLSQVPDAWLRRAWERGSRVGSICSGAFALGHAGLLDGKRCATHWKVAQRLQRDFPAARVVRNRLFVEDGKLITSAGVTSGIDMALAVIESDYGPVVTARVARELVVFIRRNGGDDQKSVYLDYRTHLHPGIHRVQDWLVSHPDKNPRLEQLARVAGMSPRNLTRMFRRATGVSLKSYSHRLKLEVAGALLFDPNLTLENVANQCGFEDSRQLRRLWKRHYGLNPSQWRNHQERPTT